MSEQFYNYFESHLGVPIAERKLLRALLEDPSFSDSMILALVCVIAEKFSGDDFDVNELSDAVDDVRRLLDMYMQLNQMDRRLRGNALSVLVEEDQDIELEVADEATTDEMPIPGNVVGFDCHSDVDDSLEEDSVEESCGVYSVPSSLGVADRAVQIDLGNGEIRDLSDKLIGGLNIDVDETVDTDTDELILEIPIESYFEDPFESKSNEELDPSPEVIDDIVTISPGISGNSVVSDDRELAAPSKVVSGTVNVEENSPGSVKSSKIEISDGLLTPEYVEYWIQQVRSKRQEVSRRLDEIIAYALSMPGVEIGEGDDVYKEVMSFENAKSYIEYYVLNFPLDGFDESRFLSLATDGSRLLGYEDDQEARAKDDWESFVVSVEGVRFDSLASVKKRVSRVLHPDKFPGDEMFKKREFAANCMMEFNSVVDKINELLNLDEGFGSSIREELYAYLSENANNLKVLQFRVFLTGLNDTLGQALIDIKNPQESRSIVLTEEYYSETLPFKNYIYSIIGLKGIFNVEGVFRGMQLHTAGEFDVNIGALAAGENGSHNFYINSKEKTSLSLTSYRSLGSMYVYIDQCAGDILIDVHGNLTVSSISISDNDSSPNLTLKADNIYGSNVFCSGNFELETDEVIDCEFRMYGNNGVDSISTFIMNDGSVVQPTFDIEIGTGDRIKFAYMGDILEVNEGERVIKFMQITNSNFNVPVGSRVEIISSIDEKSSIGIQGIGKVIVVYEGKEYILDSETEDNVFKKPVEKSKSQKKGFLAKLLNNSKIF